MHIRLFGSLILSGSVLAACATPPVDSTAQQRSAATPTEASSTSVQSGDAPAPRARLSHMVPVSSADTPMGQRALALAGPIPAGAELVAETALAKLSPAEQAFAREVASQRDVSLAAVAAALDRAQRNATVLRLMAPPAAPPSATPRRRHWPGYRDRFVDAFRIRAGQQFWDQHAELLAQAERDYGVPAAVIVAIIGVETVYGRNMGDFRVLDALYTLAFHWPDHARNDRSPYFRGELAEYLATNLSRGGIPGQARGSFAGAVGMPQFMPTSIREYAISTRPGQPPDLIHRPADVVASVANYLVEHGWQADLPVFLHAEPPINAGQWVAGGLEPTLTWPELAQAGAQWQTPAAAGLISGTPSPNVLQDPDLRFGVINLDHANGTTEYRIATPNFFAITHYNRSYFYATAVADLAAALERGR